MFLKKTYGQSKVASCPFCGAQATTQNSQNIPVCRNHTNDKMPDIKCVCGEWLDLREGKWGPFYTCFNCGIVNMTKAQELMDLQSKKAKPQGTAKVPVPETKEIAQARKFEELSKKLKDVQDIPTLDELAKDW